MPDMIAAAAVLDGKTVAVAGASEDSPLMWQIGIDVLLSLIHILSIRVYRLGSS